jgi:hypothetical protein
MTRIKEPTGRFHVSDADRKVIAEFKKTPVGHHTPALQRVLNRFRGAGMTDKYCLIMTKPYREWQLAMTTGDRAQPVKLLKEKFRRIEDAEWHVFKLRWKLYTGETLH